MVQRRDGQETRQRLVSAAADVFAEVGYGDARIVDICRRAGANVAAVNYHFGGKQALYVEVWRRLCDEAQRLYPPQGSSAADAPLEERLYAHVLVMLRRMMDSGRLGRFHRLRDHERANPTGLIDDVIRKHREPGLQVLESLVREALGKEVADETARLTEMCIINQCRGLVGRTRHTVRLLCGEDLSHVSIEQMARHNTAFSMGGMERIRHMAEEGVDG